MSRNIYSFIEKFDLYVYNYIYHQTKLFSTLKQIKSFMKLLHSNFLTELR